MRLHRIIACATVATIACAALGQSNPAPPQRPASGQRGGVQPQAPSTPASSAVEERLRRFKEQSSDTQGNRDDPEPSLRPARLYSPAGSPLEVIVRAPDPSADTRLFLLDAAGEVLGIAQHPTGRVNLIEAIPAVASLERAAWLQLALRDRPIGSAIVIQPMREPPPVRTSRETRPGTTTQYTKVIGWGSEPLDADDPKMEEVSRQWIAGDPPVLSGFKCYAEMDALMRTDHGEILVALAPDEAPMTVWNFRTLVREGFYDSGGFHRIVPADREGRPFVIQGGDPTLTGNGGPGFALALEPSKLQHDYGVISMARADEPHSAGSQFFFALGREACARLDGQYCAFGYAVAGNRTIDAIAALPIEDVAEGRPSRIPRILTVRLVEAPSRMPGVDRRGDRIKPTVISGESLPTSR